MHKKVLTEQAIYYGDLKMPNNFEIDRPSLGSDIFKFSFTNKFPESKELDKVRSYIRNYLLAKYNISVEEKKLEGFLFKPSEITKPCIDINFESLKDSVDYTMLYGVGVEFCMITIEKNNNIMIYHLHIINISSFHLQICTL